jgi:hypothetical protein
MSKNRPSRFTGAVAVIAAGVMVFTGAAAGRSNVPRVELGEPEIAVSSSRSAVRIVPVPEKGSWTVRVLRIEGEESELWTADAEPAGSPLALIRSRVEALASDAAGRVYLADTMSKIRVLEADGREAYRFRVAPKPDSIAVTQQGEIIVAAPSGGKLLHLYSPQGRWLRSFGDVKEFEPTNRGLNDELNRGQVLAGADGQILYVFFDAPVPSFLRFSPAGELIGEHAIEGASVDAQLPVARQYLDNARSAGSCGGSVNIVRAAALDPTTGHLWLGLNGTNQGGNVVEYSATGERLGEIDLRHSGSESLVSVIGLAAAGGTVFAVLDDGAGYRVPSPTVIGRGLAKLTSLLPRWETEPDWLPVAHAQLPCPAENAPDCSLPCNDATLNDCAGALYAGLVPSYVKYAPNCNPVESTGRCGMAIQTCNPDNGARANHSNNPKCSCAHGGCSSFQWVTNTAYCSNPTDKDYCGCCFRDQSPIFIDLGQDGFTFGTAAQGVIFAVDEQGSPRQLAWPKDPVADPWLALDRNENGEIDSLVELFGNMTRLKSGEFADHGYQLLDELDLNRDGYVDELDPVYSRLVLWGDANRNGVSEPEELQPLARSGVLRIATAAEVWRYKDAAGNRFRYRSHVSLADPRAGVRRSWDVFVLSDAIPPRRAAN